MARWSRVTPFVFSLFLSLGGALAQQNSLSAEDQDALQKTQDLLKNKKQRMEYIEANPDAMKTMDQVKKLGGSEQGQEAMFDLSSEILQSLVQEANGDVNKLQDLLVEAQKNPTKFYERLNAQQKSRIRQIASDIESNKTIAK